MPKWSDSKPSKNLIYYAEALRPKRALQLVGETPENYATGRLHIARAIDDLQRPLGSDWR